MRLLNQRELQISTVVANYAMNRERQLRGSNSYECDLGLDALSFLQQSASGVQVSWLDLCCGTGRALVEAAAELAKSDAADNVRIEGIDLAGVFDTNPFPHILTLRKQGLESWQPTGPYALATCVHGLHYVGDKLAIITKAVSKLLPAGQLIANLDLANFRFEDGRPAGRAVASRLRSNGLTYDARRRLLRCTGPHAVDCGLRYLGADDSAGPNYTGQAAVDSYYTG